MKTRKIGAFTLIELLVVIAIIAILAAILFPVFAQAKRAAKGTVALSGAKQMCLGQLMYAGDYDDYFSPTVAFSDSWDARPFTYLTQPYMKSWQLLMDPTGPLTNSDIANANAGTAFQLYGQWGMPPARTSTTKTYNDWVFGNTPLGAAMTGGQKWHFDGIGGVGNPNPGAEGWNWAATGYVAGGASSLSTTAVGAPADQLMIAQAGTYDFMWQMPNGDAYYGTPAPDDFDLYWGDPIYNTYGPNFVTCGPTARKNASDGPTVGYFGWPSGAPTQLPNGIVIWAATDGHAKATPWKILMGTTITLANGDKAIKAFWPAGQ